MDVAAANAVFLLGEHDDGASFRRLVGEGGNLRRIGELPLRDALHGDELRGLAVAEGDRAGLVEEKRVDVAGRFDGAARHGEHVEAHEPVHAGDADGRQQRADRGGDQRNEKRDEDDNGNGCRPHSSRSSGSVATTIRKIRREAGKQDRERDLRSASSGARRPRPA